MRIIGKPTILRAPLVSRRRFLKTAAAAGTVGAVACPAISRAGDRPQVSHGVQSGDVSTNSGVVWARADRPARMQVELATTDSFKDIRGGVFVDALPESDFTAKALHRGPAGRPGHFLPHPISRTCRAPTILGEPDDRALSHRAGRPALGVVRLVGRHGRAGLGHRRGARRHAHLRDHAQKPAGLLHPLRRHIYADAPIAAEVKLPDGTLWKNIVTEEKSKPAETLAEFRGNFKYNLLDANLRAFNAEVPMFAQWDDHEVTNNWWPGEPLTRAEHQRKKYAEPTRCCWRRAPAAPFTNSCR